MNARVRPPAVAGLFYPGDAKTLRRDVGAMLAAADAAGPPVKALICPHAGYIYSGPVAASAYRRLEASRGRIRRVVLLGPTHRVPVRGMALPTVDAFRTPLGDVAIDDELRTRLLALPQVVASDAVHAEEHSLEVQIPFLQELLGDFTLLPIAVGEASPAEVAAVLDAAWGGPETLIVVSSDLSHYLPYASAQKVDHASVAQVVAGGPALDHQQACGATPINGLLLAAKRRGLHAELLDLRNSGDTAGDKTRVVGYAAFAVSEKETGDSPELPESLPADALGETLLNLARNAIVARLGGSGNYFLHDDTTKAALARPGATFVTLTQQGRLRGCIGSLEAHRALGDDVRENAVAAAFRDPRFSPLGKDELDATRVEVSLLTPAEPFPVADEDDACRRLVPNEDGLIFEAGRHRATFLPQVWEQLPDPRVFLAQLKQKAGLPADYWSPDVKLSRYRVAKWKEAR